MPLNLRANDGDFTPFLAYNAKAGRFYARVEGEDQKLEVEKPRLLMDMANIKTGWIAYGEGAAPEKVWDPSPSQEAPRPQSQKNWKRGFEVLVFGNDPLPGFGGPLGLREFNHNAGVVINSILEMHAQFESEAPAHPDQLPFYQFMTAIPIESKNGTNFEPKFILAAWVDRFKCPALAQAVAYAPAPSRDIGFGDQMPAGPDKRRTAPVFDPNYDPRDGYPSKPRPSAPGPRQAAPPVDLDDEIPF